MMKKIIILFLSIFLFFGCLSVKQENCEVMLDNETHDECLTLHICHEYLETNDSVLASSRCRTEMHLNESVILCYKSLAVTAAYQDHNIHGVGFCDDIYQYVNDPITNPNQGYNEMIGCLTEVAVIVGDENICKHAEHLYNAESDFWSRLLGPTSSEKIKVDICEKRAILSRKRKENIASGFFN